MDKITKTLISICILLIYFSSISTADTPKLVVGGKAFTEQFILASLVTQMLRANGYEVEEKLNVTTRNLRESLLNSEVDLYWEYTGTGYLAHLRQTNKEIASDSSLLYHKLKELDAKNGVVWLPAAPLNNTFCFAMTMENSAEKHIKSLSDMFRYAKENKASFILTEQSFDKLPQDSIPSETLEQLLSLTNQPFETKPEFIEAVQSKIGVEHSAKYIDQILKLVENNKLTIAMEKSFQSRPDGFKMLSKHYGGSLAPLNLEIITLAQGVASALKRNQLDVGLLYSTDALIEKNNLYILEDDKAYFPYYNASINVMNNTLERHPIISEIASKVSPLLDTKTITKLNYQVDIENQPIDQVAKNWLKSKGLLQ